LQLWHKTVENFIYRSRWYIYAMKIGSTVVDWTFMSYKLNLP